MNIIIAGGTGLIGQVLTQSLAAQGHHVWVLSRTPGQKSLPAGMNVERWDAKTAQGWGQLVNEVDAIINLTGANIGARPWTKERKRLLRSSRVDSGQAIVEAVQASQHRPRVVLQIAGVGFYGTRSDSLLDENAPMGDDFLAGVSRDWENAIRPVADMGVRLVTMRTGVVLTPKDGVLAPFVLQNHLFAGGPLGSGKQWISWIHNHDLVRAFSFLLEHPEASGVLNVAAPDVVTNAEFGRTVSRVMHRPFWLPVPAFALRLALGEMSTLILEGQRVSSRRLQDMGFQFEFGTLQKALEDLLQ